MATRKCSKAEVPDSEKVPVRNADQASIKYELGRAAGAFESLGSLKSRELKRLAEKGMNATAKLSLLSRDYLPQLCEIVHRGLTLEEVRLITGTSEDELRAALRRPIIRRTTINTREETNRDDWVNIAFIVREIGQAREGPEGLVNGEQMLAPARFVNRRTRHRCYERLSGTLPNLYMFRRPVISSSQRSDEVERLLEDDPDSIRDKLVIDLSLLKQIRSLVAHERASDITKNFALFYRNTRQYTIHYAYRYKALNDEYTFRAINDFAEPLGLVETYLLQLSKAMIDPKVKEQMIGELDAVVLDIKERLNELTKYESG
jgi:hypothetical protein